MTVASPTLEWIALADLHEPWLVMRPVDKDSIEYLERVDSLTRYGPLNSLLVRPSSRKPGKYEVVDGLWRLTASHEVPGLDSLPCIIKTGLSDFDVLAMQIQANAVRAETTPVEYSRQLRRIIDKAGGRMTVAELARIAGKHPDWVKDRLNLLELAKPVQTMVDRGEIPIRSAYMLAKIPSSWRKDYVDHARAMSVPEFGALAAGIIKRFSEAVRIGKLEERFVAPFEPQPYLRGAKEAKEELAQPKAGAAIIVAEGVKTPLDAWRACLRWMLHLDRESVEKQQQASERKSATRLKRETETAHEVTDAA